MPTATRSAAASRAPITRAKGAASIRGGKSRAQTRSQAHLLSSRHQETRLAISSSESADDTESSDAGNDSEPGPSRRTTRSQASASTSREDSGPPRIRMSRATARSLQDGGNGQRRVGPPPRKGKDKAPAISSIAISDDESEESNESSDSIKSVEMPKRNVASAPKRTRSTARRAESIESDDESNARILRVSTRSNVTQGSRRGGKGRALVSSDSSDSDLPSPSISSRLRKRPRVRFAERSNDIPSDASLEPSDSSRENHPRRTRRSGSTTVRSHVTTRDADGDAPTIRRGRGRPRKHAQVIQTERKSGRPRGRPRRNVQPTRQVSTTRRGAPQVRHTLHSAISDASDVSDASDSDISEGEPLEHVEFSMPLLDDEARKDFGTEYLELPALPPEDDQTYASQRPRRSHIVYDSDEQMELPGSDEDDSDFEVASNGSSADERDIQAALGDEVEDGNIAEQRELVVQESTILGEGANAREVPEPEEPQQRHWPICVCNDGPAHLHLVKLFAEKDKIEGAIMSEHVDGTKKGDRRAAKAIANDDDLTRIRDSILEADHAGAWLRCRRCCSSHHWTCLTLKRQKQILSEYNALMGAKHRATHPEEHKYQPITSFGADELIDFALCAECTEEEGKACAICHSDLASQDDPALYFRCKRCVRCFHYACIQQVGDEDSIEETAQARQACEWQCIDCDVWGPVDQIVAWRPSAMAATNPEPEVGPDEKYPIYSTVADLPREYLVKFGQVSFRDTQWVPHSWLARVATMALQNFLRHGTRLELEKRQPKERLLEAPQFDDLDSSQAVVVLGRTEHLHRDIHSSGRRRLHLVANDAGEIELGPPHPEPDAQERIPRTWKTPDRMLDVFFHSTVLEGEDEEAKELRRKQRAKQAEDEEGDDKKLEIDTVEKLRRDPSLVHIDDVDPTILIPQNARFIIQDVARSFIKWQDLDYSMCTWEKMPDRARDPEAFQAFIATFRRLLDTRRITLLHRSHNELVALDKREGIKYKEIADQPSFLKGGTLLDFQLEGLNWLLYNWYIKQPCILADEMGLGKTIQVIGMLGALFHRYSVAPFLVVAPTSTILNWVREFETWLPTFRVVPYHGDRYARETIEQYELYHARPQPGQHPLKAHVVIMSDVYARNFIESLDIVERWEVLVVDEGQMLKSGDKSLLYRRLRDLDVAHRIIMTGTPLNNNIGELFNLLNWLDPNGQWSDLDGLRRRFDVLTPELVEELQPKLRPYFLRRVKKNVVDLPERTEIVVPLSLRPVQKEVYKSLIEKNVADIHALVDTENLGSRAKQRRAVANLNNVLMQLRKTVQHPYLITPDLETVADESATAEEQEHQRFVEASSKLVFLKRLLPKLQKRGHRVLLFSQFAILLDIMESFLMAEDYKYFRIDGTVGPMQRQSQIDAFNDPKSDCFIFLLTSRAGGYGINLASADTVIVFDPDFNPFADQQAISRAHRIGQTKHVLVFQLMCKSTAEQSMIEKARKKLVIDHLIVQNLDLENSSRPEEMENIIKFGAKALFEEGGVEETGDDVRYSDEDIDDLIRRAETPAPKSAGIDEIEDVGRKLEFPSVFQRDREREAALGITQDADEQGNGSADMHVADHGFWEELLQKRLERRDYDEDLPDKRARVAPTGVLQSVSGVTLDPKRKKRRRRVKYTYVEPEVDAEDGLQSLLGGFRAVHDPDFMAGSDEASEDAVEDLINVDSEPAKRKRGRPRGSKTTRNGRMPSKYTVAAEGAMKVLEQIPVDIMKTVLDRKQAAPRQATPTDQRPQLTEQHCRYFVEKLGFPRVLFDHAFLLVSPDLLPPQVKDMEYEGASMLSESVVQETLLRAAHYLFGVWRDNRKRLRKQEDRKARKGGAPPVASPQSRLERLDQILEVISTRLLTTEERAELLRLIQTANNDRLLLAATVASNEKDIRKLRDLLQRVRMVFKGLMDGAQDAAHAAAVALEQRYGNSSTQGSASTSVPAQNPASSPWLPATQLYAPAAPSAPTGPFMSDAERQKREERNRKERERRRKKASAERRQRIEESEAQEHRTAPEERPQQLRPDLDAVQNETARAPGQSLADAGVVPTDRRDQARPRPRPRISAPDESSMSQGLHDPYNKHNASYHSNRDSLRQQAQPSSLHSASVPDQRSIPPAPEPVPVQQQWRTPSAAANAQVQQWNARPFEPSGSGLSAPSPGNTSHYFAGDGHTSSVGARYSSASSMAPPPGRDRGSNQSQVVAHHSSRDAHDYYPHRQHAPIPLPQAPDTPGAASNTDDDGQARCLICWATPFHYMTTCPMLRDTEAIIQRYTNLRNLYLSTPPGSTLRSNGGDPRDAESNDQWRQELQVVLMFMFMNLSQRNIANLPAVPMQ